MIKRILFATLLALTALNANASERLSSFKDEAIYHIFFRSFADSNGDRIGDLNGLTSKLDYIKSLGMTSILLTPILPSPFYHNYFPTDFYGIEKSYGTRGDYLKFLREAHKRGLKVYLDIEIQYVGEGHPWWTKNSNHLLRRNHVVEPFLTQAKWESYDGTWHGIAMIDLSRPQTQREIERAMLFWADPHGDGSGRDGADGFRIDHMMDDLDNKGVTKNLFANLWQPIFTTLRALNPEFRIIGEQSDWGYGKDWLTRGDVDAVFAFPLRGAILKLDRDGIIKALRETATNTPAGKHQITFLENHDTDRLMSSLDNDARKVKLATIIMLFSPGTPLLYYGEEIGMRGVTRKGTLSDGAHVPLREAMRWNSSETSGGAATWYRGDRLSWDTRYNRSRDGVSVEEQSRKPLSLLNWHRAFLKMRNERAELRRGELRIECQKTPGLLCIERSWDGQRSTLIANLGDQPIDLRKTRVDMTSAKPPVVLPPLGFTAVHTQIN